MKFSEVALHICFEGNLSQHFYLCPSFYFMLCRKRYLKNIPKYTKSCTYFDIKSKLRPASLPGWVVLPGSVELN